MLQQHTQPSELGMVAQPQAGVLDSLRVLLSPRVALRRAFESNRSLTLLGILMLVALAVSLVGLVLDPRTLTGASIWLKPFKFSISIIMYSFTLLWMLSFVQGHRWLVRAVSSSSLLAFVVEMVAIITQVLRGTTSHFNNSTAFDETLFSAMGTFVLVIWVMNLVAAVLLLFQRLPDPAFAWALRLGLLLTLLGGASGVLMTMPTAAQNAAMDTGQPVSIVGAHSVGVADGGPGLPIVGWSTTGGDLRIGHFVGLHAMQVLPIIGLLLMRRRRLGNGARVALVWIAAVGYLGLMALLLWQALRGQPLLAPDAATLAALAALVGATALAAGVTVARGIRVKG